MLIRSIVTLLAASFVAYPLPVYGQGLGLNLPSNVPLQYTPLPTPCRAVDTRVNGWINGSFNSGPAPIPAGATQQFDPSGGGCKIPYPNFGFIGYALNVTVVPHGPLGYLTIWPFASTQPLVATLSSEDGEVKAKAALVEGGASFSSYNPEAAIVDFGAINVYASNTTDLVLDVTGYFTVNTAANVYVPVTPCRVVDTRLSNGTFGAPALVAGQQRSFLLADSHCDLPADMTAVSLNVTAVPIDEEPVYYLTVWGTSPTEPQTPPTSTLNADTGAVTANAAIATINPDTYGSVSVYASNNTNLVLDVTGYFAPAASAPKGLSLVPVPPCRALDTRQSSGAFQGELTVPFSAFNGCGVVADARADVVNAGVIPTGSLGFLTLWPDGTPQPLVSTLNASDGKITSNMAIVSTTNGSIDAFASSSTQLTLDISGYFAEVPFASGSQPTVVFVGDQILAGEVQYANNPNWTFNPVISGYEGAAGADTTAASFSNVLLMNPRPNIVVIQDGNIDGEVDEGEGCGPGPAYFGLCWDWLVMVEEAKAAGIKVIMGNLLPFGPAANSPAIDAQIATINQSIPGLLNQYHPLLLDFNSALSNGSGGYNPRYSSNGVLPNAAGYAVMTTMIQAAVKAVER
jgi:hypothetical protein